LVTDSVLAAQIVSEDYARQRREQTASFDEVIANYRDILYSIRQDVLDDSYICPLCRRIDMRIKTHDEASFCSACRREAREQGIELSENLPRWRLHFERMAEASVDSCLGHDKLERYVIDKYTSDVMGPKDWDWDKLVGELNEWLTRSTNRERLSYNIDFKNELYPEAERQKLLENIKAVLVDDAERSLMKQADGILAAFRRRDPNPLNWDVEEVSWRLNRELLLSIRPTDISHHASLRGARTAQECLSAVRFAVREAIKYKVSGFDLVYPQESTILRLLNFFNPLLQPDHRLAREDALFGLEQRDIKSLVLDRVALSYNELIRRFGKADVFEYESEIMLHEIDEKWRTMLVETELMLEELKGWTVRERVLEYGARVARLFQQIYWDIGRETVRKVLLGEAELERRRKFRYVERKKSPRISGDSTCTCGSGAPFSKCCGVLLYQGIRMG